VARALARLLAVALLLGVLALSAGAATPRRGGTLFSARPPLTCLSPFGPCGIQHSDPTLNQVLEGAFEVGPDLVYRPNLVSRVDIGRNPFTLTYRIRPQAHWNDGVPVSATDFRFTYQVYATRPITSDPMAELYEKIRRARVLGPKTFRVELREPFAGWRALFDVVLPQHALAGEDLTQIWRDRLDNPKTGRPIGNGPFLVSRLEPGKRLVLVRNGNYWGPRTSYLDRWVITLPAFNPADPLGPLRRNEIDFTATPPGFAAPISAELAAEARRIPGWRTVVWPTLAMEHLMFRVGPGGHPALRNRLVRRAIAYGIDRVALARQANPDLGRRARPIDSTVFFADEPSYRPAWAGYRYDPRRARRLLEQAGCRRGADGIYSCAGQRLRLRFFTTAGNPQREQALQGLKAQLRRAGVDVEAAYSPARTLFETVLPRGNFDAALFSWGVGAPGGNVIPEGKCGDVQNWAGYCNRRTMRDVQRADRTLAQAERARLLNAVDARLAADAAVLPLWQGVFRAAVRSRVRGFIGRGTQFNFFENTEDWWLAR
jgi:peptide/nickel transport system substrate-binding protein